MPTSRSAAVRRGLAASARESAARIVSVWARVGCVSPGLAKIAIAHKRRAAVRLQDMKVTCEQKHRGRAGARLISSGQMFGRRRVGIKRNPDQRRLALRARCGNDVGGCSGQQRLRDSNREAAVTVMATERPVVVM